MSVDLPKEDMSDLCTCGHLRVNHYLRAGKHADCGWCGLCIEFVLDPENSPPRYLSFIEYGLEAGRTDKMTFNKNVHPLIYYALGLIGESGEVVENVKKMFRDDGGKLTPERVDKLTLELGDVLWYLSRISAHIGRTLEDVARENTDKLRLRYSQEGK